MRRKQTKNKEVAYINYENIYEEGLIERIQQREAEYRAYIDEEFN